VPRKRKKGGAKQNRLDAPIVLFTGNTGQRQTAPSPPANAGKKLRAAAKGLKQAVLPPIEKMQLLFTKKHRKNKSKTRGK
jgi:hypothetical protein